MIMLRFTSAGFMFKNHLNLDRFQKNMIEILPLCLAYLCIVIFKGHILEDSFIVGRSVENFYNGYFFSALPDIRSQSYTSPLWTLFLVVARWLSPDYMNGAIFTSLFFDILTLFILYRFMMANNSRGLAVTLVIFTLSQTMTDYSTGGLENPLAHFLIIAFAGQYLLGQHRSFAEKILLGTTAGLIIINRQDHALFVLPVFLHLFWQTLRMRENNIPTFVMTGFVMFIWFFFSWFYYGDPLPDTYYAKMQTGILLTDRMHFALLHLLRMLDSDPLGIAVVLFAVSFTFSPLLANKRQQGFDEASKSFRVAILSSSLILYNLYFIYIGADYMLGRFYSVQIALASFLIGMHFVSQKSFTRHHLYVLICATVIAASGFLNLNLFTPYRTMKDICSGGMCDHQKARFDWFFILQGHRSNDWKHLGLIEHDDSLSEPFPYVFYGLNAGIVPFYAGPRGHMIDALGLSDPLLSKLPCRDAIVPAHCQRVIPDGYPPDAKTQKGHSMDPSLKKYWDALFIIKTEPLFSLHRLKTLVAFSKGEFDKDKENYINSHPEILPDHEGLRERISFFYDKTILKSINPMK